MPTCEICQRKKVELRAEVKRLLNAGVAREVLGPPALRAFEKDTHDTADHPTGGVTGPAEGSV